jgi:hypothetical protein
MGNALYILEEDNYRMGTCISLSSLKMVAHELALTNYMEKKNRAFRPQHTTAISRAHGALEFDEHALEKAEQYASFEPSCYLLHFSFLGAFIE